MTIEEFRQHYAEVKKLVESWPAWKQNILGLSASPTVKVPRQPVDNRRNVAMAYAVCPKCGHKGGT